VYEYALASPRIRFLIADGPGAGKTVMAGLVFTELQYRRLAQRVLIVEPGHLKYHWQREMQEKFGTILCHRGPGAHRVELERECVGGMRSLHHFD